MIFTLLFTFYVNGVPHTFPVGEAADLNSCKQLAFEVFKRINNYPDHVLCARKA